MRRVMVVLPVCCGSGVAREMCNRETKGAFMCISDGSGSSGRRV